MNRRDFLAGLAVSTVGLPALAATKAEAAAWTLLGRRQVNLLLDHDTIHVGAARGLFDKMRLRVLGNGLFILDLKVVYHNGAVDHVPVRFFIPQGGHTRVIDLRGGNRFLRSVQMTYTRPVNGRGRTWVEVWGRR